MIARDYAAIALEYAHRIVSGDIVACKWTVAAYQRQLDDFARQQTAEFPYRYDPERGARVCVTHETLPHIKGRWKTSNILLEPWQIAKEMTLFSWLHDGGEKDGARRFRIDYEEVARKNAKTTRAAGRAMYMLGPDGEQGAECYFAATTRDQARIAFEVARSMARKTPAYCARFHVEPLAHSLVSHSNDSSLKPLSADYGSLDGLNPHFAGVDELHAHENDGVWNVLVSATGARDQSLIAAITTAGWNRNGICYQVRGYLTKILNGVLLRHPELCKERDYKVEGAATDDESWCGTIYTLDDGDDWADPAVWVKANPNLDVSVKRDDLANQCRMAQQTPAAVPNFLTKRLNVWVHAESQWMDMRPWHDAGDTEMAIASFVGQAAYAGVTTSSKTGIAPVVYVFKETRADGRLHYSAFSRLFIPDESIEESNNPDFAAWARDGHLIATDGNETDFARLKDDIRELHGASPLTEVGFDPKQARQYSSELLGESIPMVEVTYNAKNLSEPMKELEAAVRSGRFHHEGNPAMALMVSNVVAKFDQRDNITPTKKRLPKDSPDARAESDANTIEGAVALIIAMSRAMYADPPAPPSIYETEGVTFI